jgi:succinate-semialdehyde dehydrogenase/glutarate-semialdehyde dehydrogenase
MTGSTFAGRAIAAAAAERPIPALLELGGNCPFVTFEDCDIDRAVQDLLDRKVRAAGQACSSVNRVFVHEHIEKRFIEALRAKLTSFVCGVSDLAGIKYGPVRTSEALHRLNLMEEQSVAAGASVIARGPLNPGSGRAYCRPLSVLSVSGKSVLDEEESFGPLMSIQPFALDGEVEEMLASNRQNLVAYFYGAGAGDFVARHPGLRFGSIGVNTTKIQGAALPTGGFDEAGYGREGGMWGIEAFRTTVNLRSA